ncbi:MAG TPA: hypothetical protein VFL55_25500 [Acetobacteraceae bacterium]|nr:hypothetical protein [Acetobacteraceae bacterium]
MDDRPICIVHITEDGDIDYLLNGEAVLFLVVDERAPGDRVYQMTRQTPREEIASLIAGSPIGSRHDSRHVAIAHRIERALQGKSHLQIVDK